MPKKDKQYRKPRQTLRKYSVDGVITATNAIDAADPVSGIVCKGQRIRNYEIPDKVFQRELAEYLNGKQSV